MCMQMKGISGVYGLWILVLRFILGRSFSHVYMKVPIIVKCWLAFSQYAKIVLANKGLFGVL